MDKDTPRATVAFIVSHPDDVSFSMGGTAALLKDRYKLHVLCASRGERGYTWDGHGLQPPDHEIGDTRAEEERASCKLLGADLTFLDQPDGGIFAGQEVCNRVAGMLSEIKPVAVLTMGPLAKPDHASTYMIALQALHRAGLFWETELYMCESLGIANVFVNTTAVMDQKKEQCFCHQHHLHDPSYWDRIADADRIAGSLCRCEYAEAYLSGLPLVGTRWNRKAGSLLLDLAPGSEALESVTKNG